MDLMYSCFPTCGRICFFFCSDSCGRIVFRWLGLSHLLHGAALSKHVDTLTFSSSVTPVQTRNHVLYLTATRVMHASTSAIQISNMQLFDKEKVSQLTNLMIFGNEATVTWMAQKPQLFFERGCFWSNTNLQKCQLRIELWVKCVLRNRLKVKRNMKQLQAWCWAILSLILLET